METQTLSNYKAISSLKLFDLKAQKKTIPLKKFCNIPLTHEEMLKENFDNTHGRFFEGNPHIQMTKSASSINFKRNIDKLAQPKNQRPQKACKNSEIDKIMKKCKKMMNVGTKFQYQMTRFEKISDRCLSSI